jgi:hypothetical protein
MLGLDRHIGQSASSPKEPADLSLEKGRRNFFTEDEFKSGRSKSNISCRQEVPYCHASLKVQDSTL